MGYYDLLPRRPELQKAFSEAGLTEEQQERALTSVAFHLREWADYHANEAKLIDNPSTEEDQGAANAFRDVADDLDGVGY